MYMYDMTKTIIFFFSEQRRISGPPSFISRIQGKSESLVNIKNTQKRPLVIRFAKKNSIFAADNKSV